jgi:phosphoribosyl-ATP pyrophosphohydrolase
MTNNKLSLESLFSLIEEKISKKEKNSYSYQLAKEGIEKITRKIGEEAIEVIIAGFVHNKNKSKKSQKELVGEVCDLFYHSLVLLASEGIDLKLIFAELALRNKKND